ncbi:hypothetical protein KCP73_22985 [Salmonella enterica subsp. enterica]|nr:hypothetical protein KCP73_22985 [Salmonella enterica subsp. enterica]
MNGASLAGGDGIPLRPYCAARAHHHHRRSVADNRAPRQERAGVGRKHCAVHFTLFERLTHKPD